MAVTERLAIVVEANADKAIASFRQVGAAAKGMAGPVGQVGGLMQGVSGQLKGLAQAAGPTLFLAAAGAIAGFAASSVKAFADLAAEVENFQRVAGGTTEDASRLVAAFDDVGVDSAAAAAGVFQLEKRLVASGDKLADFNIVAIKNRQGLTDMSATLLSVGDAYKATADPAQRAALLTAAFGKTGQALVPLLERSREEIKGFFDDAEGSGQILSREDILRARQLREAMDDLQDSLRAIQIEAGRGLIPAITAVVGLVEKLADKVGDAVSGPDKEDTGVWATLTEGTHEAIQFLEGLFGASNEANHALSELEAQVGSLGTALQGSINADRALDASKRGLAADQRGLADATKDYNTLLKEGAVDAEKVADAQRSLAEATRSVGHAQREQTKAQDEFNEAAAAAAILGTDTAFDKKQDAADNLADANDSVASALERQTEAAADLAKAKAGDPDYQDKLADAKQRVADNTQKIADAEYDVGQKALAAVTAHDAETEALAGKAAAAERLIADYNTMIALHPEVAGALQPAITAAEGALGFSNPGSRSPVLGVGPTSGGGILGGNPVPLTGTDNRVITITNNFTTPVDAAQISGKMLWDLN